LTFRYFFIRRSYHQPVHWQDGDAVFLFFSSFLPPVISGFLTRSPSSGFFSSPAQFPSHQMTVFSPHVTVGLSPPSEVWVHHFLPKNFYPSLPFACLPPSPSKQQVSFRHVCIVHPARTLDPILVAGEIGWPQCSRVCPKDLSLTLCLCRIDSFDDFPSFYDTHVSSLPFNCTSSAPTRLSQPSPLFCFQLAVRDKMAYESSQQTG